MENIENGQPEITSPVPVLSAPVPLVSQPVVPPPESNGAVSNIQPSSPSVNKSPSSPAHDPPPIIHPTLPPVTKQGPLPPPKPDSKPIISQQNPAKKKTPRKRKKLKKQYHRPPPRTSTSNNSLSLPSPSSALPPRNLSGAPSSDLHPRPHHFQPRRPHPRVFPRGDQPFDKKKFRYTPCAAAPDLPQLMYRQIILEPRIPRVNWQDMNPCVLIDREGYVLRRTRVIGWRGQMFV